MKRRLKFYKTLDETGFSCHGGEVVEKRLCILTGEVPPINKRSCKKFEQIYEVKNRLSQNIKGDGNNA